MRIGWKPVGLGASLAVFCLGFMAAPPAAVAEDGRVDLKKDVLPVLEKYCAACHKTDNPPGGANPFKYKTQEEAAKDAAAWEKMLRAVRSGHMPPKNFPEQPSAEERSKLVALLENFLKTDCGVRDPGRVTIRRLNRSEYAYTIEDLLGVKYDPTDIFPNDDVGYGFDNIGDVLTTSPMLMEKYLTAAETIAAEAIVAPGSETIAIEGQELVAESGGNSNGSTLVLFANGTGVTKPTVTAAGDYRIKVTASGQQAGPDACKMRVIVNGQTVGEFDVPNGPDKPQAFELPPVPLKAGANQVGVSFLNDYYQPNDPDPKKRDRNLVVHRLEVSGPVGEPTNLPTSHKWLVPARPAKGREIAEAKKALRALADRAFRRPATNEEVDRLASLVKLGLDNKESYERSLQIGVTAVLVSPQFLFRAEIDPTGKDMRPLNSHELASRLSYFLWSSLPDAELNQIAASGKLSDPAVLKGQVARMLKDPKRHRISETFGSQWLELGKLKSIKLDRNLFFQYSDDAKESMRLEALTFFDHVLTNDRPILDFLDADYMFVNEKLATIYEMQGITGREIRMVKRQSDRRGGLLGMGAVLMLNSNPTRTSPTKRGKWILEQILGEPPPPPPPGVEVLKPEARENRMKTLRAQLEQHRVDPACAGCHASMDPLGFGLENFDALGTWRNKDNFVNVDSKGELPDGTVFSGPAELKQVLLTKKDRFSHAFAEKLLTFAIGRGMTRADTCYIDEVAASLKKSEYKISAALESVALSDAFRMRNPEVKK